MKSTTLSFLGIDISKLWFDVALLQVTNHIKSDIKNKRFTNDPDGIKLWHTWLKKENVAFTTNSLVVMENTGVYHRLVWQYCSKHNLPLHIGNAAHIKWSLGITRGKNDIIDSQRLCVYAFKHADDLKATPILNSIHLQLKDLMTARSKLLSHLTSTKVYLNELKLSKESGNQKTLEKVHKAALEGLKKSIKSIEAEMKKIISESTSIKENYSLLLSVPGIGPITATYLICCTANFAGNISGKQLASYAGVVPFEHSSGTSIKRKNKVHKMANKELKTMLHMCAISAMQHYEEFKDYYQRKKEEGKHPLSILNAIRNKIALRAVAVIKNKQPYVNKYSKAA